MTTNNSTAAPPTKSPSTPLTSATVTLSTAQGSSTDKPVPESPSRQTVEDPSLFRLKTSSSLRLILVDVETESRLLGCVLCGPSFLSRSGDLPMAMILGLELHDVIPSQLSILSMTPNEVTLGLRSDDQSELVFSSEAGVVFVERSSEDPVECVMEGLILIRESTTKKSPADFKETESFRCVYARSSDKGIFWYKSRSHFLARRQDFLGFFAFEDLVAMRQSSFLFEFERKEVESTFNSSIEFVLRKGPSVTFALSFPFPLVQWLYCAHAALKLPRMFLTVSNTGTWNAMLEDGFSLASPLVLDCLEVTISSLKIGWSLTSGCGGTLVDLVSNEGEVLRKTTRLDDRKHASNYPVGGGRLSNASDALGSSRRISQLQLETSRRDTDNRRPSAIAGGLKLSRVNGSHREALFKPRLSGLDAKSGHHVTDSYLWPKPVSSSLRSVIGSSTSESREETVFEGLHNEQGALILKVDSRWSMGWDWRQTQDCLLNSKRPLTVLVGRCEPLMSLSLNDVLKAKQVQLLLSSATLTATSSSPQQPIKPRTISMRTTTAATHRPILEMDSRDARRRAATRRLFRRQTDRIEIHPNTTPLSSVAPVPSAEQREQSKRLVPLPNGQEWKEQDAIYLKTGAQVKPRTTAESTKATNERAGSSPGVNTMSPPRANWVLPSALERTKSLGGQDTIAVMQTKVPNKPHNLVPLVEALVKADSEKKREDVAALLLTLTNDKVNKKTAGPICIPPLIQGCNDSSSVVQELCAGSLWNLSDEPENALLIARQGGVQAMSRLLNLGSSFTKEEACGALWALADDETNVPLIVLSGALEPLLRILDNHDESSFLEENASGCVWTMSTNPGARKLLREDQRFLRCMTRLLKQGTYVSRENALGALANMFADESDRHSKQVFLDNKGAPKLVQSIMFGRTEIIKRNATTCLLEIARDFPEASLLLASEGAITALLKVLVQAHEPNTKIKAAEAIRVLAQVPENAVQLSELGSVPDVLRILEQAKQTHDLRKSHNDEDVVVFQVPARVLMDDNLHPDDLLVQKQYVHFDSALLDSGLEEMVATHVIPASTNEEQGQSEDIAAFIDMGMT